MFQRLLSLFSCLIVAMTVQSVRSQNSDPRVEIVKSIEVSHQKRKVSIPGLFGQTIVRATPIIRDLFTTKDPTQGVIALLPLTTTNGYKEVLVWIPPAADSADDSRIQLVELPVEKDQLKIRSDDFSLATPPRSVRYRWTAGGETGYMIAGQGKIQLWTKGAAQPVVFERASYDGQREGLGASPWNQLRDRMIIGGWFSDYSPSKVTLLNAGPAVGTERAGLEAYLNQLDKTLKYSVIALSTEHEQTADYAEEKKSINGVKNFVVVMQNDTQSNRPIFEKSNLIGFREDGTYEVFPGLGRVGLQNPSNPQSGAEPHIGFRTGPNKAYYIDESVFVDIAKDVNTKKSPLYGNSNWSLINGYYYQFVYFMSSADGRTLGSSDQWKIAKLKPTKLEAQELIGRYLPQQIRQLPNSFVEMLKGIQTYKVARCLRLFE